MNSGDIKKSDQITQSDLFQTISDICTAVNFTLDSKALLESSLKQTMELFGAQRGSIFILKENGKDLMLKIARGMAVTEEEKMVKKLGEGVVGRVAASKKPIFVTDISRDERFLNYKSRGSYKTPSFICAPLLVKDKLIGVINIADKKDNTRFLANELQILDFLSSQIALNYRRIQLYRKFKSILRQSQNLKSELGKTSQEATHLKKQIVLNEKLATIGKLAGGIAHEFNNPLDGVIRYTNLCLEHVNDGDVLRGYLLEIKHGLNRMVNIVKSLLACSRTQTGMQKINLSTAIDQALHSLQGEITAKNISIAKKSSTSIPEITDFGLERVVFNLAKNAIDAIERDGKIQISADYCDEKITLTISDTGCGIPEEGMERIFEPFYTTKDIDKGCGLGLTIVSEIIKSYNGVISVDSAPTEGTTFIITIPLH